MAKHAAGTHQPLGYRAHVRLRALHKNLHSKFHAVRIAAAREIQAILNKKRGLQNRLRERLTQARNATVRKVTPRQLHKPLRVQKRATQAPKRGQATPIRARMPRNGFTPLTDHTLTRAELRQRTRDAKAAAKAARGGPGQPLLVRPREVLLRQGQHEPYPPPGRKPDAMQQATETMRKVHAQPQPSGARSPGRPGQTSPFTEHKAAPSRRGGDASDLAADKARTHRAEAKRARTEHNFAEAQDHERHAEALERAAAAGRAPAERGTQQRPARTQDKPRWHGVKKRLAAGRAAPARTAPAAAPAHRVFDKPPSAYVPQATERSPRRGLRLRTRTNA